MGVATSHQTQEWLHVLAFLAVHIHCTGTIMNEIFFSLSIQSSKPNLIAWNVNSRIPPTRMPFENTPPRYASHFTTKCESKYRHNAARDTSPIPLQFCPNTTPIPSPIPRIIIMYRYYTKPTTSGVSYVNLCRLFTYYYLSPPH